MPTPDRLRSFVDAVLAGDHVEAIKDFYHADASMQENCLPPRLGRETLISHEAKVLSRLQRMHTHPPKAVVHDGDRVVIHWVFDAVATDGTARRLEELAFQIWRGDRIAAERFFYDTASAWCPVEPPGLDVPAGEAARSR